MPYNLKGGIDVPIDSFNGWQTEVSAPDVQMGYSPDCQNISYVPGSAGTRGAFRRVFPSPVSAGGPRNLVPTFTYGKTFISNDGTKKNLYLDSNGKFYIQAVSDDGIANPSVLFTTTVSAYAKSVTAFGREYIAFSDGLHGLDVPLQYDGTNVDRVTQDGPGAPPAVSNKVIDATNLRSYSSEDGDFVIIPVNGGGSVAIGCGIGDYGDAITLPDGYSTTNMVACATPGAGWNRSYQVSGVYAASAAGGSLSASFMGRDGTSAFNADTVNWSAASWSDNASVTQTTVNSVTYVSFETENGDNLCVACGQLTTTNPSLTVPTGFTSANFLFIAGPGGSDSYANGMQGVNACTIDSSLTKQLTYKDGESHTWTGPVNMFGLFYAGTGITTETITGGTSLVITTSDSQTAYVMFGQITSGSSFGLPTGVSGPISSSAAMSGYVQPGETWVAHGWPGCQIVGQTLNAYYLDGQGNSWAGVANFMANALVGGASGVSLIRESNTVTAQTLTPNNLKVGYQVQISGVSASEVGGGIVNISINNEDNPGIATVSTHTPHGLLPDNYVTIKNVEQSVVGTSITSAVRAGYTSTFTTSTEHTLSPGAVVTVSGVTDTSFNTTYTVQYVTSTTTFTAYQVGDDATSSGGTVKLSWPVPDTSTPSYFEVVSAPTPTTFQVSLSYSDGTWTGGNVYFSWNGTFYVTAIDDDYTFEYQQYGPDASTTSTGVVTPYGQIAPGKHQLRVSFLTRQGYITRPSPPVLFVANGGQYLQIDDIPIGPSNIIARILELTGSGGDYFFYLPVPAIVNGQKVSTATQIGDNTTTSALIDVSDNSLFAGIGTSTTGNNTPSQTIIDSALGFGYYESRLLTWGQRNTVQGFLGMGFESGWLSTNTTVPTGWTYGGSYGELVDSRFSGKAWQITTGATATDCGLLQQAAYVDAYGAPLLTGNTQYSFRCYIKASQASSDVTFEVYLRSTSGGWGILAEINATSLTTDYQWIDVEFSAKTPEDIPEDAVLAISATTSGPSITITVDEMSLYYTDSPYRDTEAYASYVNNPEGFAGVTGNWGVANDWHKILDMGIIRNTLYIGTRDPGGRIHQTNGSGVDEPSGWVVEEVASNCGPLSAFCMSSSQANDSIASGGEEWLAWASESGARVFGGSDPAKISQEIQPNWYDPTKPDKTVQINMAAATRITSFNDPVSKVLYFFLPLDTGDTPNVIYPVNYRGLETSGQIAASMQDRKWTRWTVTMNGAARMYLNNTEMSSVFLCGNGSYPSYNPGYGEVYTLDFSSLVDDDYGAINDYYITAFTPQPGQALSNGRTLLAYLRATINATGKITITPLINVMDRASNIVCVRSPGIDPQFDIEWPGAQIVSERMAFKIQPESGQRFEIQKLIPTFMAAKRLPVRGSAQ